jgi:murein DD-endopeptidase MepM/ murein hydrolase activator NlpD
VQLVVAIAVHSSERGGAELSWQKVMERILPPIDGIFPRETSTFGAVKGRKPPSSIPHRGVDFNYAVGQSGVNLIHPEVYAPVSGIVTRVGGRYGLIAIRDANGLSHEILHTSSQKVKVGQKSLCRD